MVTFDEVVVFITVFSHKTTAIFVKTIDLVFSFDRVLIDAAVVFISVCKR
jgi:hypothetical protein